MGTDRASERALGVTEQLAFQQLLRQRATVDGDEGTRGARAGVVDGLGHQLLARTGRAGDQHADIGCRHHARLLENLLHLRGASDDASAPGIVTLLYGRRLGQRLIDGGEQLVLVDRLGQEAEHALTGGTDGIRDGAVCGQQDDGHARLTLLQLTEQGHAIHFIHAQVGQDQVWTCGFETAERLAATAGRRDLEATAFETHAEQLEQARIIIDEQNMRLCVFHTNSPCDTRGPGTSTSGPHSLASCNRGD